MASENPLPDSSLPVKVAEPDLSAPPSLAEPASGPAAAIPGAEGNASVDKPAAKGKPPCNTFQLFCANYKPAPEPAVNGANDSAPQEAPADAPPPPSKESAADGAAPSPAEPASEESAPKTAEQPAPESTADETTADANGTPGAKKGSNGKRKSVVPEHNKKLNKKKSAAKITHLDAQPGDYYFARLKSYPPWPAIVCDEDILPSTLLNTRPVTTKKVDGTYNEAYADGGKKVSERTFPVMFLHTNEFAWIPNTDLADLDPEQCKNASEKGKTKALVAAYAVAAENHDLDHFKNMLAEHAKAMEEDEIRKHEEQQAKLEAKSKAKADKKKRKSEPKPKAADDDEDLEMADVDDSAEVKKSSKKRKKVADSDDEAVEKPAKTPKTKLKLTTKPQTAEKPAKKPAKKTEKRKSKAAAEDVEDMPDAPEEEEPPKQLDPAAQRKAREKEVLFLRHRLQKGFLTRDQAPQEDDMPQMSQYIKKLEDYEDLEVSIIRTTKINKVLKALIKLNTIPKDEEFAFRKRSVDLLSKWTKILGAEPQESEDKETAKSTPATNGVHENGAGETEEAKKDEPAPAAEPEPEPADKTPATEQKEEPKPAEPDAAPATSEEKPAEAAAPAPAPAVEEPKTEVSAATAVEPSTSDKAPESAPGAAEAIDTVKASE
ncbi:uncharacterized protein HMPREF1541_02058 [Cyphellophora europaea CBS 101466]|uniref:PWWP domain-containing protein n=1 Tax=Cyphellophora europaea (strain CBS 101466) TaxID=1220924 RepID=W2S2U6_CYPE1|nr:uncharacterized protein HMPREF1541_02058 [Cyphellophora europaea CBS 101466]ETN42900.1 hypothetical protein HMPREF1541_02058 [Cyphellophora europaea CBS 101466]